MDGFAVCAEDLSESGATLRVVGEARAGESPGSLSVARGEAVRIFTGAVIPAGANAVVMVEETAEDRAGGTVRIDTTTTPGRHVRPRASDRRRGEEVVPRGRKLRAAEIAALTSVGCVRPRVFRRPTVAILSTGDEIVEADRAPESHQVRNSNAHGLLAQLSEEGLSGEYLGIAGDRGDDLEAKLGRGLDHDVLLVTGGVSVGEYDLVGRALERAGMELLFHRVAVKPGKPILAGRVGGCLAFGLPGNPVSAFCGFLVFVAPVLRRMAGRADWRNAEVDVELVEELRRRPGRLTFALARLERDGGRVTARTVASTGSGDVLAMARANAFLVVPAETERLDPGATLRAIPWGPPPTA
jgi:molybdopterin molybdotransferase